MGNPNRTCQPTVLIGGPPPIVLKADGRLFAESLRAEERIARFCRLLPKRRRRPATRRRRS